MGADFGVVVQWWGTLFFVGAIAFPLTKKLFPAWWDRGYLFAKATGMAIVSFLVYLFGMYRLAPFTVGSIFGALTVTFIIGALLHTKAQQTQAKSFKDFISRYKKTGVLLCIEEICFFLLLLFWSWIKGHEPSIHGLEKFMDYGFMKSILNSAYFPAADMWYAGYPINYYYFGHTVVAVLTRLSGIDLSYTFNLMLATIFALTGTMSFSIGLQILQGKNIRTFGKVVGAMLTGFLVTLAGNMQTIYAFTKGYVGEDVKPFWQLLWPVTELWTRIPEGLERYWYANATRFIPFTIHEFPSYSFVVSDIHGHVLSLPFTLLAIAILVALFTREAPARRAGRGGILLQGKVAYVPYIFYGLLVAILLMTNALDGPIYLGLFLLMSVMQESSKGEGMSWWKEKLGTAIPVVVVAALASIPFMTHFSSFVSGLAINCPPAFLAGRKIGIFVFEGVEKCQHSPLWMMWLLWGFFIFCGLWFITTLMRKAKDAHMDTKNTQLDLLLVVFFLFSVLLILFPEFFYFKDIYPAHFRSNTMFKLGYQAFILFSIVSGYTITRMVIGEKEDRGKRFAFKRVVFILLIVPQLFLVLIYPIFSVRSYFDSLRTYKGLDGTLWLKQQYPDDYAAIQYINDEYISTGNENTPISIVEADGDSYTDFARFSAFTGFPAIIGWPVHEWLWRGTYDVVAPRREEVRVIYESDDMEETRAILQKYAVKYIIVGQMEKQKFLSMNTEKFDILGTLVFTQGETQVYRVTSQ